MNKNRLFSEFQKLGKVLMAPVLILPIAGILVGIGSGFTNPKILEIFPFLKHITIFFNILKDAGNVVNNNIPVIFAICISYGFVKSEKATAALSGFLGYMTMNTILGSFLIFTGDLDPKNLLIGQKQILGVLTLDTGVFGGILVGFLIAYIHNKFYKIQLPAILSIFNGTRAIPALSIICSSILGILLAFIFPPIQHLLIKSSDIINSIGASGAFLYGLSERLLLPFGLHHFIYLPFFFTQLGGYMNIDGDIEDDIKESSINKNVSVEFLNKIIEAVGGRENILKVDACFTRLRLTLENNSKIKDIKIFEKDLGASGAVLVDNGIQIIYGNRANLLKIEMREYLKHE